MSTCDVAAKPIQRPFYGISDRDRAVQLVYLTPLRLTLGQYIAHKLVAIILWKCGSLLPQSESAISHPLQCDWHETSEAGADTRKAYGARPQVRGEYLSGSRYRIVYSLHYLHSLCLMWALYRCLHRPGTIVWTFTSMSCPPHMARKFEVSKAGMTAGMTAYRRSSCWSRVAS